MERYNAPPAKKKIKKESLPVCGGDPNMKKTTVVKESEETNGPLNNKDYVCISPETISVIAESIGIPNVGDDIALNLAEDVSYKLQEIINASCTIMRRSKRRKLLTSDVSSAFQISDVHHILGHSRKDPFKFTRLPEGELYISEDNEVDLMSIVSSMNVPKLKKPSYVITSYPILRRMHVPSINGHTIKTEGKFPHGKSMVVNGDIKMESAPSCSNSLNDHVTNFSGKTQVLQAGKHITQHPDHVKKRITPVSNGPHLKPSADGRIKANGRAKIVSHGVREKLRRDTEDELKLSEIQLSYFRVLAKCIIQGHDRLFQESLSSLRHSKKVDVICAPLLNFIALTVCHIPRHYGLALRLLDIIDVMLCNVNINPTFSIAVNRIVNALLAIAFDQNIIQGRNDFFLRRKAAQLLTRVLLVWGIEEQHVSELLSRVARVLGDSKEKVQSHYGALVIFQSLGKAALGWLSPLLKCFLPLLEKRYPLSSAASTTQAEEIRGVLLDIVELLACDANLHRFKIKSSTIQETQAMIQLDYLLYNYCGDAVCARRRPSPFKLRQLKKKRSHSEKLHRARSESRSRQPTSNCFNLRYISHYPQKLKQSNENFEIFEDACRELNVKKKDIFFKFAGANPIPKDGLRKKVLDKTHVQFVPLSNSQLHSIFPRQYLMVGRMHRSRCKGSNKRINVPYSLFNVL